MRNVPSRVLYGVAIALLVGCGSSDEARTADVSESAPLSESVAPPPSAPTKPTDGALGPGSYRNDFFGFTITFPESWEVLSSAQRRMNQEAGVELMAGNNRMLRAAMNVANEHTYPLLMIMEQPLGSNTMQFNPSLQVGAVDMKALGDDSNEASFLAQSADMMQFSQLDTRVVEQPEPVEIGGRTFYRSMLQADVGATTAKLRFYARREDDFMIFLLGTYAKFIEGQELQAMVNSLSFDE